MNKMWSDQTISRQNKQTNKQTTKLSKNTQTSFYACTWSELRAMFATRLCRVPGRYGMKRRINHQKPCTCTLNLHLSGPSVYYWCSIIIKLCLTVAFRCRPARCEDNPTKQHLSQNRVVIPRWQLSSEPWDHILWEGRPVRWKMSHFDSWRSYEACYHWWSGTRCSIYIPGAWIRKWAVILWGVWNLREEWELTFRVFE